MMVHGYLYILSFLIFIGSQFSVHILHAILRKHANEELIFIRHRAGGTGGSIHMSVECEMYTS